MPTTKQPLKRYSILDRCFSNTGRNYTFEGLKEAVNEWMLDKDPQSKGISTRQRDDIAYMKSSEGWEAPIITKPGDGKKRYYCYDDPSFSISKRPVNETQVEELMVLDDALDVSEGLLWFLRLEDHVGIGEGVSSLGNSLDGKLSIKKEKNFPLSSELKRFAGRNHSFTVQLCGEATTTLTSHISKDGHDLMHSSPDLCRSLTVHEAALILALPDNYLFYGQRTVHFNQVGDAVQPCLALLGCTADKRNLLKSD